MHFYLEMSKNTTQQRDIICLVVELYIYIYIYIYIHVYIYIYVYI